MQIIIITNWYYHYVPLEYWDCTMKPTIGLSHSYPMTLWQVNHHFPNGFSPWFSPYDSNGCLKWAIPQNNPYKWDNDHKPLDFEVPNIFRESLKCDIWRYHQRNSEAHAVLCEGSGLAELCQAPPVPGRTQGQSCGPLTPGKPP